MMKYYYYRSLLLFILCIFFSENSYSSVYSDKNSSEMVVIIDPGHGGKDPGAVIKGIREKDIVLGIGLKLGKYITENYPDVKVIYTRSTDVFVPLIDRSLIANKSKADLFISLHANTCGTPSIRGTETFVLGLHRSEDNLEVAKKENSVILLEEDYKIKYEGFDPNLSESYIMFELVQDVFMDQSLLFADAIQNQFKSNLNSPNRGVKQAGFLVLRQSSMPSVLIESGFLSNTTEAKILNSDEGQRDIALSILAAFRKFKSKNSASGTPLVAETKTSSANQQVVTSKLMTDAKKDSGPAEKVTGKKPEVVKQILVAEKSEPTTKIDKSPEPIASKAATESNTYYSVQIGANTKPVEPVTVNFKGLKGVRREKTDQYYRYFVGKEDSIEKITPIWQQIKLKFPQAFIVAFVDGKRIIITNVSN